MFSLFAAGALLTLLALTIAVVVVGGPLPGEVGLIRQLQRLGQPAPAFADMTRVTTGTEANLVIGSVAAVWLIARHGRRGVAAVLICVVAMVVVQPVSKVVVDRNRPTEAQVEVRADHSSRSYPSGHSLSTATMWGTAALYAWNTRRRRLAVLFSIPIAGTAVAAGIHGVHWASDSIAGTIIGLGAAWIAVRTLRLRDPAS